MRRDRVQLTQYLRAAAYALKLPVGPRNRCFLAKPESERLRPHVTAYPTLLPPLCTRNDREMSTQDQMFALCTIHRTAHQALMTVY